jgi:hypothetical protein
MLNSTLLRDQTVYKTLDVNGEGRPKPPDKDELSEFEKELKAAFDREPEGEKVLLPKLIDFYKESEKLVDNQTTWVGLFRAMQAKATEFGVSGKLTHTSEVVARKLGAVFPSGMIDPSLVLPKEAKEDVRTMLKYIQQSLKNMSK